VYWVYCASTRPNLPDVIFFSRHVTYSPTRRTFFFFSIHDPLSSLEIVSPLNPHAYSSYAVSRTNVDGFENVTTGWNFRRIIQINDLGCSRFEERISSRKAASFADVDLGTSRSTFQQLLWAIDLSTVRGLSTAGATPIPHNEMSDFSSSSILNVKRLFDETRISVRLLRFENRQSRVQLYRARARTLQYNGRLFVLHTLGVWISTLFVRAVRFFD